MYVCMGKCIKIQKKKSNIKYVAIGKRITEWECKLT